MTPAAPSKLSAAIRAAATITPKIEQTTGQYVRLLSSGLAYCAMGAAIRALDPSITAEHENVKVYDTDPELLERIIRAAFPEAFKIDPQDRFFGPCPLCCRHTFMMESGFVIHLNDCHRLPFDQIADVLDNKYKPNGEEPKCSD